MLTCGNAGRECGLLIVNSALHFRWSHWWLHMEWREPGATCVRLLSLGWEKNPSNYVLSACVSFSPILNSLFIFPFLKVPYYDSSDLCFTSWTWAERPCTAVADPRWVDSLSKKNTSFSPVIAASCLKTRGGFWKGTKSRQWSSIGGDLLNVFSSFCDVIKGLRVGCKVERGLGLFWFPWRQRHAGTLLMFWHKMGPLDSM